VPCVTPRRAASRSWRAFSSSTTVSLMRFCRAAGVQRPVQLHADAGGVGGAAVAGRGARAAGVAAPTEATASTVGSSPARAFSVSSRATSRPSAPAHGGVLVGGGHPFLHVGRRTGGSTTGTGQRLGLTALRPTSWSSAMRLVRRSLSAASSGGGQVEAGLRFARVGDGGGADLEIALGRGQLLGMAALLALGGQRVLRGQHVEVGLGHAHDQVLLGGSPGRPWHVQRPLACSSVARWRG
jgi:hypothetical protein